jgi:hypothetical protein
MSVIIVGGLLLSPQLKQRKRKEILTERKTQRNVDATWFWFV